MNGRTRLLPLFFVALFLAALAGALSNLAGPRAYLPRFLFLGSIVSLLAFLYRARREILFLLLRVRRVSEPGPAATWILAAAILVVGSLILESVPARIDATRRGLNRLSAASRQVLASGEGRLELIGVYRETSSERERAFDLLEVYRTSSRRVRVRMLDPDREPTETRRLGLDRSGLILVRSGEVKEEVDELSEEALTQAILRVDYPGRAKVIFLTGHGERSISEGGTGGLGRFAVALREAGYSPVEMRLFDEEVPTGAAMLAIVGARRSLLPVEITKIGSYLDRGGRVMICLEPGTDIGMDEFLRSRGVILDSLEVYDESPATRGLGMGARTVVVSDYGSHPILIAGMGYTVFTGVRAVHLSKDPVWGITAKVLLRSGPLARLVAIDAHEPDVRAGQAAARPLAVAEEWEVPSAETPAANQAAPEKPYARLVVFGDSDWLSGQFLELFSNRDLALRCVHWLASRSFLLRIPPIDTRGTPLRIGLSGMRTLFVLLQVGVPVLLLGAGLWLWSRRR